MKSKGRAAAAAAGLAAVVVLGAIALRADVETAPAWRLGGAITTVVPHGDTIYVGGSFTQLFTPSTSQQQFYDPVTALPRPQCARSTSDGRGLAGVPDGRGGLLVVLREGDAFADVNGAFAPPAGTTFVRIGEDCLWDRGFAAPAVDPAVPDDLTIGVPVPVGGRILAANSVVGPDGFLRAQVASFDPVSGARTGYQVYPGVAEIGFYGPGPTQAVARVRGPFEADYRLGAVAPATLDLTVSATLLADESLAPRWWLRGGTLFRARPAPSHLLEAYDLTTLEPRSGWTPPAVVAPADLEVAGARVFVASGAINGQNVAQPAALLLASGAVDPAWIPPLLAKRVPDASGTPYVPVLTQLATDGQRLYMSGDFERLGATDREGLAALVVGNALLDPWDPTPLIAQPLEVTAGGVLLSRPTATNRLTRRYLAAIDRATGLATSWHPNDSARILLHTASPVSAVAVEGAWVYFASATTGELLRADRTSGDVDQNWRVVVRQTSGLPGVITSMAVSDAALYLAGEFDTITGTVFSVQPRRALAAVGVDGVLRPWAPAVGAFFFGGSHLVRTLLPLGPTIYLAGDFVTMNGQFRRGFAAVDAVTGELSQPEMVVLGDTRVRGLATDGFQVFVAGESYGAPLVGAVSIPGSELTPFRPANGRVAASAAFVAGRLYAEREYDIEAAVPTARTSTWAQVIADGAGLLNLAVADGLLERFAALPGNPPGAPVLTSSVTGNTVQLSWVPGAGGAASSYTVFAGSVPGAVDLAAFPVRGTNALTVNAPNGRYYVRVVGRNVFGNGPPSNEVTVQVGPPPCTVAPVAPGPLSHTLAGFAVSLAWGSSPTAAAYLLEAGSTSGATDVGRFALSSATALVVSAPPGTYYARVRATNACGVSPPSNEVAIVVTGAVVAPNAPTGLTAAVSGRTVAIAWTPPQSGGTPAGYQLEAGYAPGAADAAVVRTAAPSLLVTNVPSATYYVRVRAFNAAGGSVATGEVVVAVP
ncbi:MAG: hypothetical protein AB7H93_02990 [Vicinamibacterales bacterium]